MRADGGPVQAGGVHVRRLLIEALLAAGRSVLRARSEDRLGAPSTPVLAVASAALLTRVGCRR